jgi:hypothetical protein
MNTPWVREPTTFKNCASALFERATSSYESRLRQLKRDPTQLDYWLDPLAIAVLGRSQLVVDCGILQEDALGH